MPGNLDSLGLFRERVLRYSGHTLKRRSQTWRYAWVRRLKLAAQWLPTLRVLHPWPLDRFAATHPRYKPHALVSARADLFGRRTVAGALWTSV